MGIQWDGGKPRRVFRAPRKVAPRLFEDPEYAAYKAERARLEQLGKLVRKIRDEKNEKG